MYEIAEENAYVAGPGIGARYDEAAANGHWDAPFDRKPVARSHAGAGR
eukprot:CAMPEP_0183365714 /NCGR_PEP_ID=MMETSP0164_2-20130417/85808_1 /TAXON_ID=221442 /ORGANISM="Coccolithus pelagicus ssp braarudi, Strain PLY182g" /LENGTH=47 /DNA_ID= /DNA_START= /DNA_END= /DNA_ORIENTATION=